jgi:succinate dehydrogenase/fumarate reductase flavoprotein subunit
MLYDVLIIGSGIAGLRAALEAKKEGVSVAVLSKSNPFRSNSAVASGGINAALGNVEPDSAQEHSDDTLRGGAMFNNRRALAMLCNDAPGAILELDLLGVPFDKLPDGKIAQRAFGGAGKKRTCHIADRTGSAIVQTLLAACRREGVEILPNIQFLNIITEKNRVAGITALRRADSMVIAFACKSLILAGGGYAGIYRGHATNPQEACGDTLAAALRAGMTLRDMEMVQFHPTALPKTGALITEAARGEGGWLLNAAGERFVDELITRDKLSRAMLEQLKEGGKVFLDLRHLDESLINAKLPSGGHRHYDRTAPRRTGGPLHRRRHPYQSGHHDRNPGDFRLRGECGQCRPRGKPAGGQLPFGRGRLRKRRRNQGGAVCP